MNLYVYAKNNPVSFSYNNLSVIGNISDGMVNSIGTNTRINYGSNLSNSSYITFPSLYDTLGFVSNVFTVLNGIKVAKYLTHIHGNPPKVGWFIDNLSKHGKISEYLGYAASAVDGINVYVSTNDFRLAVCTIAYDVGSMIISSSLGGAIGSIVGGFIGGPAGAIVGTLLSIGIETLIQYFKDDVINWIDKKVDNFINLISNKGGGLVNA